MTCKHLYVRSEVNENKEWVVSYHCDKDDTVKLALEKGEDSIEYRMWLGDNAISFDKGCPSCEFYEEEE